jgi:hypothetical protein
LSLGLILRGIVWVFAGIVILAATVFLVIEAMDKVESIQKRAPWIPKILERRSAFVALLLICFVLLIGDGYELLTKELPEVPTPIYQFRASPVPDINCGMSDQKAKGTTTKTKASNIQLLYRDKPLDGSSIEVFGSQFTLDDLHAKSTGPPSVKSPHWRLYFSHQVASNTPGIWVPTSSDESNFPFAYYAETKGSIDAGEQFNFEPAFAGTVLPNWDSSEPIRVKLKFFYGSEKPALADFVIKPPPTR